jgi:hypothetical protein
MALRPIFDPPFPNYSCGPILWGRISTAKVTIANVMQSNGMIHVIHTVLLPK